MSPAQVPAATRALRVLRFLASQPEPVALDQIWHHQRWLAAFPSRGSSANNHAVAEAAGQLAASCAFGWFPYSPRWRADALRDLDRHLRVRGCPRDRLSDPDGGVLDQRRGVTVQITGIALATGTLGILRFASERFACGQVFSQLLD